MDPSLVQPVPAAGVDAAAAARPRSRRGRLQKVSIAAGLVLLAAATLVFEMRTSRLQSALLSRFDRGFAYTVEPGAAAAMPAPDGPYDARLGYTRLPEFRDRLEKQGFAVAAQARPSARMREAVARGIFPIYAEKSQAGLVVNDRRGRAIYEVAVPERVYEGFAAIPAPVVRAVVFVENRDVLDAGRPYLNPAVEWPRLAKAVWVDVAGRFGRQGQSIGASTLATQIEKFRHSSEGRTRSSSEKLNQMIAASLRAYQHGPDTLATRRQLVVDYLNSLPLAAAPGHGEVLGLGDGMWAWFGMDFDAANRLLADESAPTAARARAYKRALSLILSARRPYFYLSEDQAALGEFTDSYLRVMAAAGVIDAPLRDAAIREPLDFVPVSPAPSVDWGERKAANLVRARLTSLLGVPALYELDRLDLTASTALDASVQEAVSRTLQSLREPATVQALGLKGFHLLERGDPSRVVYSFTLYERGPRASAIRVQTDSLDQPLDINAGARLDLGSTAKLRTLISYLEIVADLHARSTRATAEERGAAPLHPRDRLGAWALEFTQKNPRASLPDMLEAAMERRYSASPGEAFGTGGGLHTFRNFDKEDDERILSVREGFRHSVNLVFIRLMRDIVDHHLYAAPASLARVLENPGDPRRQAFLTRFADREGSEFIRRFYRKYHGKPPEQALDLVLSAGRQTPSALATVLRTVDPEAGVPALESVLAARLPGKPQALDSAESLYDKYAADRFSLMDRGYIARVHPLELWLVAYLRAHPDADLSRVLQASAKERQAVYGWLFKTQRRHAQDKRIKNLLEIQVFLEILRDWQRLGYPFASLTPSYATAIGSSGDRPAALARLMGIILNGGVNMPSALIERLDFGADTPYEMRMARAEAAGERVLAPEIAAVARRSLIDVVEKGTARGLRPALAAADMGGHVVGGKTGTGDHRFETYAPGGRLIESRVVERVATFVFLIDDRFFGTVTAYVAGPDAARYEFTSALPVRLLALLMPSLAPLVDSPTAPTR